MGFEQKLKKFLHNLLHDTELEELPEDSYYKRLKRLEKQKELEQKGLEELNKKTLKEE